MLCVKDYEKHAEKNLPLQTWTFYYHGAERDDTLIDNENAFRRYKFLPRVLRYRGDINLETTILGERISFPVGIAPTAHHKMIHQDGEIATAKAAENMKTVFTLSTVGSTSFREVAKTCPSSLRWMQLYMLRDRKKSANMIRSLEEYGYKAIVVTVDLPVSGLRLKTHSVGFNIPPHVRLPHLEDTESNAVVPDGKSLSYTQLCDDIENDLTWEDIAWIRSICKLPIVLKGIMTVADAKLAVEHGAAAVWVSNHGGRQLDGTLATIDALGPIVEALRGTKCEVYVDGGVRWGSDVLKAIALGAKAVFIGRPYLWGLAHSGEEGVQKVLQIMKNELIIAMKLLGCQNLSEVNSSFIQRIPVAML